MWGGVIPDGSGRVNRGLQAEITVLLLHGQAGGVPLCFERLVNHNVHRLLAGRLVALTLHQKSRLGYFPVNLLPDPF